MQSHWTRILVAIFGVKVHLEGLEKGSKEEGEATLIMCNHQSGLVSLFHLLHFSSSFTF